MQHSGSIMCKNRRRPPGRGNVQGEMSAPLRSRVLVTTRSRSDAACVFDSHCPLLWTARGDRHRHMRRTYQQVRCVRHCLRTSVTLGTAMKLKRNWTGTPKHRRAPLLNRQHAVPTPTPFSEGKGEKMERRWGEGEDRKWEGRENEL